MDAALGENIRPCPNCNVQAGGRFCSNCGCEIAATPRTGWRGVLSDIADASDHVGIAKTFWTLIRAPISGIVKLALNPNYTGHLKFLVAAVGIAATVIFIVVPELAAPMLGEPVKNTRANAALYALLEYISFAVWMILTYYAFNAISGTKRAPNQYFKACTLGLCVNLLVTSAFAIVTLAVLLTVGRSADKEETLIFFEIMDLIVRCSLFGYNVILQKRFWQLAWYWPAGVLAVQMAVNTYTVPLAAGIAGQWRIPDLF